MISSVDRRSEYVENRAGANVRLNNFLTPYTLDNKSSILNAPCGYSNGVYASLRPSDAFGPELVTHGTFDSQADVDYWQITNSRATKSLEDGFMRLTYDSTIGAALRKANLVPTGRYKVTFRAKGTANTNFASIGDNASIGNNPEYVVSNPILTTDWQKYEFRIELTQSTFRFYLNSLLIGDTLDIDDISVKEDISADFVFERGTAATRVTKDGLIKDVQILSDDLVQNGNFEEIGNEILPQPVDLNVDFTSNGGGVIDDADSFTTFGGSFDGIRATILEVGKSYKLNIEGDTTSSGFTLGNVLLSGDEYGSGFGTHYFKASGTKLWIRQNTAGTTNVTSFNIKEVGQNWTFGAGWNMGDGKAVFDTDDGDGTFQSTDILTLNNTYRITFDVNITDGVLRFESGAGNNFLVSSSGTYTHEFKADLLAVKFRRNSTPTRGYIDNVSVIEITDDTNLPRIDYTNGTGALLLEPQSTNLVLTSETNPQGTGTVVLTKNYATSPDGDQNSLKVQKTGTSANDRIFPISSYNATLISGNSYSISAFVKNIDVRNGGTTTIACRVIGGSLFRRGFEWYGSSLSIASTYGSGNPTNVILEDYGNDWWRIGFTFVADGTSGNFEIDVDRDFGSDTTSIETWGWQLETLSYVSSYIPTNGSTVTRNQDVASRSGISNLINSNEGVLYAEISALGGSGTNRYITLSDGTADNSVRIYFNSNNTQLSGQLRSGGSLQCLFNHTISNLLEFNKVAFKFKQDDFSFWINGVEVDTDTSGITSVNLSKLAFDRGDNTQNFYGRVRSLAVFNEVLTDEELAKITSTTQQEVFYGMRDKMQQIDADYYEFGDYTTRLKKLF